MSFSNNIYQSPANYTEAAVVAREANDEMFERLGWMTLKPKVIIDLGCGVGESTAALRERYSEAVVIGVDHSEDMLAVGKAERVCADAFSLPLASQSVDLIYANFLFPWCVDIKKLLRECKRVLRTDGVLMFSALGLDTFKEWNSEFIPCLIDMHDLGDLLLQEKFADPVLDVNYYTAEYKEKQKLVNELQASGMIASADVVTETLQLTYEVIFAHAFAPKVSKTVDGEVRIPISQIKRR